MNSWKTRNRSILCLLLAALFALGAGCAPLSLAGGNISAGASSASSFSLDSVPDYSGDPYVELDGNKPAFGKSDLTTKSFETYSPLDSLGRCGAAYANINQDLMPTEKRGEIGQIKPSGWQTVKYDFVDGKYLYNRCHLIGYQLAGENANEKNLITGTRYFNVEGMLPFENLVADYVKETDHHVLYRVTPIFEGKELVARGVQMEALSVEDNGDGVCFNVFVYNVQPGVTIDYATGVSMLSSDDAESTVSAASVEIRGNSRSKVYHCPGQASYDDMVGSKYLVIFHSEQEAIDAGYRRAKQ